MLVIKPKDKDKVIIASSEKSVIDSWIKNKIESAVNNLNFQAEKIKTLETYNTDEMLSVLQKQEKFIQIIKKYEILFARINHELYNHRTCEWINNKILSFKDMELLTYDQQNLGLI